ncbi:MAG TPA: ABC transporter permease, partial [Bryobacteraceae bacterium]|nr:ABC transporter permease [Bryobacteraceae bacterium]
MRFYQALLHAFPKSFRDEYGEEMCAAVDQQRRTTHAGLMPLFWLRTLAGIFGNALAVHCDLLWQDLRYAGRTFRRAPGFTITAVLVAALGIGATTAAYTLVDHVVLRPLPFPDSDRLVKLYEDHSFTAGAPGSRWDMSPANYRDFKTMNTSLESLGAYRGLAVNLSGTDTPEHVDGFSFTWEILPTLGVKPFIGRWFRAEDDRENSSGTVILSYDLWQRDFAGDAAILGRKVRLDDQPYEVIGVMPAGFYFPQRSAELWTAMRWAAANFEDRDDTYIYGIGRLKPGVPAERAAAEMRTIAARLQAAYPKVMAHVSATLIPLHDDLGGEPKMVLMALLAAAGCVLLVACTNLASLLLARALHRRRELAVRAAMGAGRERLVRQLLTESLVVAVFGGLLGLALAYSVIPLLARLVPSYVPIGEIPPIDARVLAFALALTLGTGIGFGV